jgi:glycosyltransferase involved in cell wall biosynthesis
MLEEITPVLLTYNEAPNIARTLGQLSWARRVVVLDSGSDDGTAEIVAGFANARLYRRSFDQHATQWNFALESTDIDTDWVLALDADYFLPEAFVQELAQLDPGARTGFVARFLYCMRGRTLSGSLYPPITVLYRRAGARYVQDGHTQRIVVEGEPGRLRERILHDDRKPLSRWLASQDKYASLEVGHLLDTSWGALRWQDRLRKLLVVTPWLVPAYTLVFRRCAFDGIPGWMYALERGIAESILSIKLAGALLDQKKTGATGHR